MKMGEGLRGHREVCCRARGGSWEVQELDISSSHSRRHAASVPSVACDAVPSAAHCATACA